MNRLDDVPVKRTWKHWALAFGFVAGIVLASMYESSKWTL